MVYGTYPDVMCLSEWSSDKLVLSFKNLGTPLVDFILNLDGQRVKNTGQRSRTFNSFIHHNVTMVQKVLCPKGNC